MDGLKVFVIILMFMALVLFVVTLMQIPNNITQQKTIDRFCPNHVTSGLEYFCEGNRFICSKTECWYINYGDDKP